MAWYPGGRRMELHPEAENQPRINPTQVLFHSIAAPWSVDRIFEYWRDSTNLESHLGVDFWGNSGQFLSTTTSADANYLANRRADGTGAISVETASNLEHTDPWTEEQIRALVAFGLWCHQEHGIPLRVCRSWTDPGFGVHRMFPEWSKGPTACPGDKRFQQFHDRVMPGIIAAANPAPPTTPAPPVYRLRLDEEVR